MHDEYAGVNSSSSTDTAVRAMIPWTIWYERVNRTIKKQKSCKMMVMMTTERQNTRASQSARECDIQTRKKAEKKRKKVAIGQARSEIL